MQHFVLFVFYCSTISQPAEKPTHTFVYRTVFLAFLSVVPWPWDQRGLSCTQAKRLVGAPDHWVHCIGLLLVQPRKEESQLQSP
ncbi:hypothetical protein CHARACLAT_031968 [Characodon lateralis]|uniref:Secreted protein n=1 Tax=Characodon lateralis TaxID=208331 RepID=A0ABU7EP48_9TELE|nr:hypothetical protein [Characodon lateralis]